MLVNENEAKKMLLPVQMLASTIVCTMYTVLYIFSVCKTNNFLLQLSFMQNTTYQISYFTQEGRFQLVGVGNVVGGDNNSLKLSD